MGWAVTSMRIAIILIAMIAVALAVGGIEAFRRTRNPVLLASSVVTVGFAALAVAMTEWWPFLASLLINLALQALWGRR